MFQKDTPAVKSTYSALVRVPAPLVALMSAVPVGEPQQQGGVTMFAFEQKVPCRCIVSVVELAIMQAIYPGQSARRHCNFTCSSSLMIFNSQYLRCPTGLHLRSSLDICAAQQVAIPSYLLAIAVGELESRRIGPLSSVYSEPSVADAAAYEFQNTDRYLQTGEQACNVCLHRAPDLTTPR